MLKFPDKTQEPPTTWYRVDANYGKGWVLVGEVNDHSGTRMLMTRAWQGGAKEIRIYRCESV